MLVGPVTKRLLAKNHGEAFNPSKKEIAVPARSVRGQRRRAKRVHAEGGGKCEALVTADDGFPAGDAR